MYTPGFIQCTCTGYKQRLTTRHTHVSQQDPDQSSMSIRIAINTTRHTPAIDPLHTPLLIRPPLPLNYIFGCFTSFIQLKLC